MESIGVEIEGQIIKGEVDTWFRTSNSKSEKLKVEQNVAGHQLLKVRKWSNDDRCRFISESPVIENHYGSASPWKTLKISTAKFLFWNFFRKKNDTRSLVRRLNIVGFQRKSNYELWYFPDNKTFTPQNLLKKWEKPICDFRNWSSETILRRCPHI